MKIKKERMKEFRKAMQATPEAHDDPVDSSVSESESFTTSTTIFTPGELSEDRLSERYGYVGPNDDPHMWDTGKQ